MKKVSILLSCFNATELVESYIDSIIRTEISSCATLIAIDFPFSHKDRKFVEKQLARYPDLILVQQEKNITLYDAWNMAIDLASTEYVGNLNLDDRVSPDYYQTAVSTLDEWPADVFSTFSLMTSTIGSPSSDARNQDHLPADRFTECKLLEYGLKDLVAEASGRVLKRNVPHCAPVWRRSLHKEFGYFDAEGFDFCADYEFWLRVASANKKMIVSPERKTIFYCSNGTASDRLMHPKSAEIIKRWEVAFPPVNYKPTHLGKAHDLLHYCLNMNAIFSSPRYYSHLANLAQLGAGFQRVIKSLEGTRMKPEPNMSAATDSSTTHGIVLKSLPDTASRLLRFKNRHQGERALLLCNGPSLNKVDFSRVDKSRFVVVGLNKIFMGFERLGIEPKYIVAVNKKVIEQSAEQYNTLPITKFISNRVDPQLVPECESTFHINTVNLPKPNKRFSEDITAYVHEGWTVTHAALQVLHYMGFAEVYIVGMDHRFTQHVSGQENRESVIRGADIDHFDPRYFGNGQSWDFPDLVNSEVSYRAALEVFNRDGRSIFDCTIEGACTIFPKLPVSMVYASPSPPEVKPLSPPDVPRVSVICPVFNAARFLSESIESVLTQAIPDLELIIVDDGSTDGSFQIARRWAERDARIRITRNQRAKGVSGARNTGLDLARGEYIAFLDADDRLDVGSLKARLKAFETRPELKLVHSGVRFVGPSGEYLGVSLGNEKVISFLHASGNPAHLNSLMGRTEVLRKFRFAEELTNGEDWLFLATVLRSGVRSYFVDGGGAIYRVHRDSTVLRDIGSHENKLQQVIDWIYCESEDESVDVEFRDGLASPPKEEVLRRRRLSLFISLLLAGEIEGCRSMLSEADLLRFMNSLQPKYYQAAIRVPFARQFLISLDEAAKLQNEAREKIARTVAALNLAKEIPSLHKALFDCISVHPRLQGPIDEGACESIVLGPFDRANSVHWDETSALAEYYRQRAPLDRVMIDVGAHFGTALAPFLDMGWKIFAFEPDEKNRQKLLERLAKHASAALVKLDTRAVSNESRSGLSFYRSEESTGISGLSAFHPSHKAEQTVDTVTLTEVLAGESISAVDFLKIDTEGHDLFVLKGCPWDRFRPAVIECEFEDSKTVPLGYTFHDLASYLVEKGYTIYVSEWHPIVRYGIRHDWNRLVRYPCELADGKGWGNLLAFRDPIDEAVLIAAVKNVMKVGAAPAKKSSTAAPAPVAEKVVAPSTSSAVPSSAAVIVPPAYRVLPGPFKQLAPSLWRYQLSEQQTKRFWEAVFNRPILAGQVLVGGLTVESDREVKVRVSLGRVGNTPYEGRQRTLPLSPGQVQMVVLEHLFARPHSSVKVQIEVLSLKGEEAKLSITEVFVNERPATVLPTPVDSSRKNQMSVSATKASFSERLLVRMDGPINGQHWSAPNKIEWNSVRRAVAGERATLVLPVRRDHDMLVVVACHPDGAEDRLDGLNVEIDGAVVPHTVHQDLNPVCLIVRTPARTETSHTHTELALVVPAAPESAPTNGKPFGLAVSSVSVLPERPENTAKPELPGPRWSRRLMRLIDRRGKAKLPFPFSHFDGVTYLAENPDVAENVLAGRMPSALFHYQRYGLKEQRRLALALTRHPNEGGLADIFDGRAYLEAYADVAAAVRSESIPSALEHYVTYGRTEGRKVSSSFDGSACRGTGLDLVRLEAGRELKATLHGVKQQLSQDLAAQIRQVGSRLTKMESTLSSLERATDLEALRAEFRKDLALCARTADLQTVRHDFTASLDALRQETEKRAGQLAGEIRDRFSTAARATDVARVEQATAQTMERLRARIGELERTEQQEKERLERLHGELETVRVELEAQALTLRQELVDGLAERVRMAEFQRLEQLSLTRIEELHSELTDADRLASQRAERLQGDMEIIWQELESDVVALRQDLTSALDRLRGDREAREGELVQEIQEGLSRAARASELVRVEQLGKQSMEQLYDAVRAMKSELEAKAEAVQQELHGGLTERARVDDLERVERLGLDRLERLQAELETVRNELGAKAVALRQELVQGLGERVRADDLERMELFAVERLDRLHAELEAVRGELGAKAVALRQELEQGLKDRARHDELERVEQRAGDRWERLQAELAALASIREARESAIASQIEAVKAGFELAAAKVELADMKHSSLQRDMELEANHFRTQVVGIDQRLSSADASVRKLTEGLDQLQKQHTTDHARLTHPNSYAFNVIGYQAFPRQLTMANAGRLAKHWGPLLGVTIPEKELFYLAHRICQIENACLGRLATSIDAILLRSLVARAAGSTPLEVLEIGTLFGLGLIAMHEAIAPFFERVHFTALDPLEGYYGKEHRDILTGVPISRAVFDENLRRAGIPDDRVTVIQHLSTDAIAMEEARRTSYGLLVIDGDHRYAGVKHDLESYLGTVMPGGYVLVDDYGNPSWPDVKNYVDAEVLGRKDLELVGSDWHTAVFRVAGAH